MMEGNKKMEYGTIESLRNNTVFMMLLNKSIFVDITNAELVSYFEEFEVKTGKKLSTSDYINIVTTITCSDSDFYILYDISSMLSNRVSIYYADQLPEQYALDEDTKSFGTLTIYNMSRGSGKTTKAIKMLNANSHAIMVVPNTMMMRVLYPKELIDQGRIITGDFTSICNQLYGRSRSEYNTVVFDEFMFEIHQKIELIYFLTSHNKDVVVFDSDYYSK